MLISPTHSAASPGQPADGRHDASGLMAKAQALESAFLSEMLGHAGMGVATGEFSGGIGEEQFASFLRHAQSDILVQSGGIGLAEQLFRAMSGKAEG